MSATQDLSVAFTKASADAMEVALRIAERAEKNEKAAAERLNTVLQTLKTAGLITDAQVKTATAQLGNHAQTLDILCNVVNHFGKEAQASEKVARDNLGAGDKTTQPKTVKQSNYVGRRRGYDDPPAESDLAFRKLISR